MNNLTILVAASVAASVLFGIVCLVLHGTRSRWRQLSRDIDIADNGLKKAMSILSSRRDDGSCERRDMKECIENAHRRKSSLQDHMRRGNYKFARRTADDLLRAVGCALIADEPEYLQDLLGERPLTNQLFSWWNHSAPADPSRPYNVNVDKQRRRLKRLELYRLIKKGRTCPGARQDLLDSAQKALDRKDYEGEIPSDKLAMELTWLDLAIARAHFAAR